MRGRYAFYITRDNQLKVVAPVIDYLLRNTGGRERPLVIFHSATSKPSSQPTHESVRQIFGDRVATRSIGRGSEMTEMARKGEFGVWLNVTTEVHEIGPGDFRSFVRACRKQGVKLVALPHTFETEMFVAGDPETVLRQWDLIALVGRRSRRYIETALEPGELRRSILDRCLVTGYPELDQIQRFEPLKIRQKLGLPENRPIICLGTAAMYYRGGGLARRTGERFRGFSGFGPKRLKGWLVGRRGTRVLPYRSYLKSLSRLARRNGALLVAKTRVKHNDPAYLDKYVDFVFQDREFFPFTTLELLAVSSLYFGFYSTMAMEANAVGVYALTALHMPPVQVEAPAYFKAAEYLCLNRGGSWNWPGVSEVLPGDDPAAGRRLGQISRSGLDRFQVREDRLDDWRREYIFDPGEASANVVAAVESL